MYTFVLSCIDHVPIYVYIYIFDLYRYMPCIYIYMSFIDLDTMCIISFVNFVY